MARVALCFFAVMGVDNVLSMRVTVQDSEGPASKQEPGRSPLGYAPGDSFGDFKLQDHLGNEELKKTDASFLEESSSLGSAARGSSTSGKNPLVKFPTTFGANFDSPKLLGAGSFGEAWLATGQGGTPYEGQEVVVKLLYIKEGRIYKHVTRKMTKTNGILRREVAGAATECNFAMKLQQAAVNLEPEVAKLASRLMGCYEHNYKTTTKTSEPIYLVLENCGNADLDKYMKSNHGTFNANTLASITRQITEGLYYLSRMTPPVIHHDLKPANVVVKVHESGVPTVHLIDFGGMMYAQEKDTKKRGTVATGVYAPPEWGSYAFKMPSSSFDVYALGNCLAFGAIGDELSWIWYNKRRDEADYFRLKSVSSMSADTFVQTFGGEADKSGAVGLRAMYADANAKQFIEQYWVKTIAHAAEDRPTPAQMLKSPWLAAAQAPINKAWRQWQPPAPVVEEPVTKPELVPTVQINVPTVQPNIAGDDDEGAEEPQGFEGCLHICDTCFPSPDPKKTIKRRQAMECGIESENLKVYPASLKWVKEKLEFKQTVQPETIFMSLGPATEYCEKVYSMQMVGRNKHGHNGQQTYYVWNCGKLQEMEAGAWKMANAPKKAKK